VHGQITITNSVVGCTRCGNHSRIPDGIYGTAKQIVVQIADAMPFHEREAYVAQIAALELIIKSALAKAQTQTDFQAMQAAIQEEAPDLAPFLNNYLLSGPQWYALIKVLLVGIAALLALLVNPIASVIPSVVKAALDEIDKLQARKETIDTESVGSKQAGRNRRKRERRAKKGM